MTGVDHNYYSNGCWCGKTHVKSYYQICLERGLAREKRISLADRAEPLDKPVEPEREPDWRALNRLLDVRTPNDFTDLIMAEYWGYMLPPMTSIEEGYAVIKEEFEEFWEEVRVKDKDRDWGNMATELLQTATMCMRVYNDVVSKKIAESEALQQADE